MRVFMLETPRRHLDVSPAEKYGEIHELFSAADRRPSVFDSQSYVEAVAAALRAKGFDPLVDAFCVVGGMLNVALAMAAIFRVTRTAQLLMFNSVLETYELREITIGDTHAQTDRKIA